STANGCQRKEILCICSIRSTRNSNAFPAWGFWSLATSSSTVVGTILPVNRAPSTKGPSNATPNHAPNWFESLIASHTRSSVAWSNTSFSILSVLIRNLLVAHLYYTPHYKCNRVVA